MKKETQEEKVIRLFRHPVPGQQVGIVKLHMVREGKMLYGSESLHRSREVAELMAPLFAYADREMLAVLSFDYSMKPIAAEIAAVGGVCGCSVDAKDLFKHAIISNASHLLLVHNHPSGNLTPSKEDIKLTVRLKEAGEILGIHLRDHLILGMDGEYVSFQDEGIRPFEHEEGAA